MSRFSKRIAIGGALLLLTACGGDGSTAPVPSELSVNGTYALKTINGQSLPITYSEPGYSYRVTSASFFLNFGTFNNTETYQETIGSTTTSGTSTCAGAYTRNGNSLAFNETPGNHDCGRLYNGTWDGANRLTVSFDTQVQAVFER